MSLESRSKERQPLLASRTHGQVPALASAYARMAEPIAPPPAPPPASEYTTLGEVLGVLWRQKIPFGACALAGLLGGLILAITQRPVYQAKTSLEIRMPNDDYLNRRQLASTVEPGQIQIEPFLQTQMKLVQSDTLLMQTAYLVKLGEQAEFQRRSGVVFAKSTEGGGGGPSREGLLAAIRQRLTVRLIGQTQVLEILFEAHDPSLAAIFVNTLAAEYKKQSLARHVKSVNETLTLLNHQIDEIKSALDASESRLREYVAVNGLLPSDIGKDSIAESRLRLVQGALTTAQDARVAEEARFDSSRNAYADEKIDALESDTLRAYRVRVADLKQKLAEAGAIYKPDHYRVQQLTAELNELERAVEKERNAIVARSRSQLEAARMREKSLEVDYQKQANTVAGQSSKAIHFQTLKGDVEAHRQVYTMLLQKAKDAGVASALQTSNVQIVDAAMAPESPVRPKKSFYLALGLVGGSLFGLVGAFALDRRGGRAVAVSASAVYPGAAIAAGSAPQGTPVLGSMPAFHTSLPSPTKVGLAEDLGSPAHPSPARTFEDNKAGTPAPGATAAPAISEVLDLLNRNQSGMARVVLLTSARAGEGRTTIACNLASATAAAGKSVLLIDGDPTHPQLHEVFGVPNKFGFSDLLLRDAGVVSTRAMGAVWTTEIDGLYVLPGGSSPSRMGPFADEAHTTALINELRPEFDVILIDAPPILSVAEPRTLGRCVDATVLVVRTGVTPPDIVDTAVKRLSGYKVEILGAIHNVS